MRTTTSPPRKKLVPFSLGRWKKKVKVLRKPMMKTRPERKRSWEEGGERGEGQGRPLTRLWGPPAPPYSHSQKPGAPSRSRGGSQRGGRRGRSPPGPLRSLWKTGKARPHTPDPSTSLNHSFPKIYRNRIKSCHFFLAQLTSNL